MTIKEVEARTGLARANIRYYEEQGFFSAARGDNGYRNYSEEDVDTLLKVKLLRQLGFSLEEVGAVQRGERALEPALAERESGLERESRALEQAAQLCRDMRADGVDFCTLDARRYLDRLAREEEVLAKDQDPVRIFPWRRCWARELDLAIYGAVLVLVLQVCFKMNYLRISGGPGANMLLALACLLVMAGAEAVMLHLWGTTPGKALLGLKILREDGTPLSLPESARRAGMVAAFSGIFYLLAASGVPLFALIGMAPMAWAMWQAYHGKPLFWEPDNQIYLDGSDRYKAFWEKKRGWYGLAGFVAAWAACLGLIVGGHFLAAMPPHRGPGITVEQFVENYNQAWAFELGKNNMAYQLTVDGTFEEVPREDNAFVIYAFGEPPVPQAVFHFTEEKGVLTQVALTRSYESEGPVSEGHIYSVGIPYNEIFLAARCFLWKPLGHDGAVELYEQLVKNQGVLHWDWDGFAIDSEMRFSGYSFFGGDALLAQEGQSQSYFVECTMRK